MDLSSLHLPKEIEPFQKPVAMSTVTADEDNNGSCGGVNKHGVWSFSFTHPVPFIAHKLSLGKHFPWENPALSLIWHGTSIEKTLFLFKIVRVPMQWQQNCVWVGVCSCTKISIKKDSNLDYYYFEMHNFHSTPPPSVRKYQHSEREKKKLFEVLDVPTWRITVNSISMATIFRTHCSLWCSRIIEHCPQSHQSEDGEAPAALTLTYHDDTWHFDCHCSRVYAFRIKKVQNCHWWGALEQGIKVKRYICTFFQITC